MTRCAYPKPRENPSQLALDDVELHVKSRITQQTATSGSPHEFGLWGGAAGDKAPMLLGHMRTCLRSYSNPDFAWPHDLQH